VITAVERWNRVIEIEPNNDYALTYLANTEAEYQGRWRCSGGDRARAA